MKVALALQQDLDVHLPAADDLWLVHTVVITQPAATQAAVALELSRRLPDFRERDFWSPEAAEGGGGRQVVIGSGSGAPQVSLVIPARQVVAGGDDLTFALGNHFSDPDGDMLTYAATSSDTSVATVVINGADLTISPVAVGSAAITVTASDASRSAAQIFTVDTVANRAPVSISTLPAVGSLRRRMRVRLDNHFTDPDGDALTYVAESSDPAIATAAMSGTRHVNLFPVTPGTAAVTVTVSDGMSSIQPTFDVTVPAVAIPAVPTNIQITSSIVGTARATWTSNAPYFYWQSEVDLGFGYQQDLSEIYNEDRDVSAGFSTSATRFRFRVQAGDAGSAQCLFRMG